MVGRTVKPSSYDVIIRNCDGSLHKNLDPTDRLNRILPHLERRLLTVAQTCSPLAHFAHSNMPAPRSCTLWFTLLLLLPSHAFVRGWQQREPLFRRLASLTRISTTTRTNVSQFFTKESSLQRLTASASHKSASSSDNEISVASIPRGGGEGTAGANKTPTTRLWTRHFARQLLAEAVGTFLIVFLGLGAVMSAVYTNSLVGLWQIAVVWVIAVTVAIATTGHISGAHLNPAISIALAVFRSFGWKRVVPYCLAQVMGAVLGAATNFILYSSVIQEFEAANKIVRSSATAIESAKTFGEYFVSPVTRFQAFLAETIGTAVLSAVVFALTHPDSQTAKDRIYVPPIIGLTVGALVCTLAPLSQAGFNPARDFGPRIVAYLAGWEAVAFREAWVYIVGPILGALLGAFFIDKVLCSPTRQRS